MEAFRYKMSLTLFVLGMTVTGLNAQDTMVTKSGDIKTVYSVEISPSAVFYKSSDAADAQIERIAKEDLFMIKRLDGTMYDLGNGESVSSPNLSASSAETERKLTQVAEEDIVSEEALKLNQQLIEKYNSAEPRITGKEGKEVSRVYCALGVSEDSQVVNDDVELSFYTYVNKWWYCDIPTIYLTIKNRTSKTMYIDLGNTFFISGGAASAYYVPTAMSTSETAGSGVSVNAGAVAGALGIGGAAGKLASGINVGGGKSSTSVNVVYSQRVIAIPPLSSKKLDGQSLLFPREGGYTGVFFTGSEDSYKTIAHVGNDFTSGELHVISQNESPVNFSFHVTYSSTEDCVVTKSMRVNLFTRLIMGYRCNSGNSMAEIDANDSMGFPARTLCGNSGRISGVLIKVNDDMDTVWPITK